MKKLANIDYYVYEFLKERSEKSLWTKQQTICDYLLFEKNIEISKRCVRYIISRIRKDETIQKIILSDYNKGYRLMQSDEEFDYLLRRKNSILKMLKQYWKDVEKYEKNNQTRITFGEYERDYIESLVKVNNNTKEVKA